MKTHDPKLLRVAQYIYTAVRAIEAADSETLSAETGWEGPWSTSGGVPVSAFDYAHKAYRLVLLELMKFDQAAAHQVHDHLADCWGSVAEAVEHYYTTRAAQSGTTTTEGATS